MKARGEGDDRGLDDSMASLTRLTWVWASSGSWWRTRKPGVLQSMGLQRVGHDWATELNLTNGTVAWNCRLISKISLHGEINLRCKKILIRNLCTLDDQNHEIRIGSLKN